MNGESVPTFNSGRSPVRSSLLRALALMPAMLAAACGPDGRQVRLCERVFAEIEGSEPAGWQRVGVETLPRAAPGVALLYRAPGGIHRFSCRFNGARFERGQSELIAVVRLSGEPLSFSALLHLRRRVGFD